MGNWLQNKPGPMKACQQIVSSAKQGCDVRKLLEMQQQMIWIKSRRGSMKRVASALRSWHKFADVFLKYGDKTLPPRCEDDVCMYVAGVFRSAETAYNYCSYLRWACTRLNLNTHWFGDRLREFIKAERTTSVMDTVRELKVKYLLDENTAERIMMLSDALEEKCFGDFIGIAWLFLMRVQSETIPLGIGAPEELRRLPAGRHSTVVFITEDGFGGKAKLGIHWAKRKNRQGGSMLWRECECEARGDAAMCAVHRIGNRLRTMNWTVGGTRLFPEIPTNNFALNILRRYLRLLKVPQAESATFKCVRAGKATALAMLGYSVPEILNLGEWRGSGALSYIDVAKVDRAQILKLDQAQLLKQSVEGSSDEE